MFFGFFGNIASAIYLPRIGVWPAFFIGNMIMLIGFVMMGWWPIYFLNKYDCFSAAGCPDIPMVNAKYLKVQK